LFCFQSLVDALHDEVGDGNVKLGTEVLSLACSVDGDGWSISVDSKNASSKELAKKRSFDAVIMTVRIINLYSSFTLFIFCKFGSSDIWSGKFVMFALCFSFRLHCLMSRR
jgi:hypothetical protein